MGLCVPFLFDEYYKINEYNVGGIVLIIDREIAKIFENTIKKLYNEKEIKKVEVSVATNEKFGDFQNKFAMMNSKIIGKNPEL